MAIDVRDLGLTQEELQQRVVDTIVGRFLDTQATDDEGQKFVDESPFAVKVRELVRRRIDKRVTEICEEHILPHVGAMIEDLTLQKTNTWGEKIGKPKTFIEYLMDRAEDYLMENVDYDGKSKAQRDSFGWKPDQTRLCHIVHKHLHYSIETAMKNAVNVVNAKLVPALTDTAKIQLEEIAKKLTVTIKTS